MACKEWLPTRTKSGRGIYTPPTTRADSPINAYILTLTIKTEAELMAMSISQRTKYLQRIAEYSDYVRRINREQVLTKVIYKRK